MTIHRSSVCLAVVVGAIAFEFALPAGSSPAAAPPLILATTDTNSAISAHGGWVAWSQRKGAAWQLVAWHRGVRAPVPVAPRAQPFDVDLGSDDRGRVVATFSRCDEAPRVSLLGTLTPWTSYGCRVRVVDLRTGRERAAGIPRPSGFSDTSPSMWRGRIAFARNRPGVSQVSQVMHWSPSSRRARALRHGKLASCSRKQSCAAQVGAVQGLDLGSRLVAFRWYVEGAGVVEHAAWELRANRLIDGRSLLGGAGGLGEACTGGADISMPSSPTSDGTKVWFLHFESACYETSAWIVLFGRTSKLALGATSGQTLQMTRDASGLFALIAPEPDGDVLPGCDAAGAPCAIVRIEMPTLKPRRGRLVSPIE